MSEGCQKHRRYWDRQAFMGHVARGEYWVAYCPCGKVIGRRWFSDKPKPHNEWEWVRP